MNKILLGVALLCVTLFTACTKDDNNQPETQVPPAKVKIAEATTASGITATLWGDAQLQTGYNKVYLSLEQSGQKLEGATVSYKPVMTMDSMSHSCPVEQPVFNSTSDMYEGAIVFTMPSDAMMSWDVAVTINNETVTFTPNVAQSAHETVGSYTGTDGGNYVLALIPKKNWEVGLNDFEILVNHANGMMDFPPVDDFTIELDPEMPAMGHSSPNNTNPVSIGNGHYKGKVNFTMTGDWRLHFKLSRNGNVIVSDANVEVSF
jgi:hypothetical protein